MPPSDKDDNAGRSASEENKFFCGGNPPDAFSSGEKIGVHDREMTFLVQCVLHGTGTEFPVEYY
jgi:hypothetical protein